MPPWGLAAMVPAGINPCCPWNSLESRCPVTNATLEPCNYDASSVFVLCATIIAQNPCRAMCFPCRTQSALGVSSGTRALVLCSPC
eukprot:1159245-Pelagomonas_calceolata.AAC.1